ncbi:hypothetical protein BGZ65_011415 [Modicella reniformis]|uniref:Uncharacterized protein n=1 Tax=Modicella reniformis TaxID=1440133 RepID=A0A9P6SRP3_9FUNG|nr:hypothetical protein BGZ65_011415 [Modicella reniformis]
MKQSLLEDQTAKDGVNNAGIRTLKRAMEFINKSLSPVTMYDIFENIDCRHWPTSERSSLAKEIQRRIELDPLETSRSKNVVRRWIRKAWPKMGRQIDALFQDEEEPSVDKIVAYLEDLYPFPEKTVVQQEDQNQREQQSFITSQLASLSIPGDRPPSSTTTDKPMYQSRTGGAQEWPTQESKAIRSAAIRRLAHDLVFSSTIIMKTDHQPEATSPEEYVFRYVIPRGPPKHPKDGTNDIQMKFRLSSRITSILGEWKVGEDPAEYVYTLPDLLI